MACTGMEKFEVTTQEIKMALFKESTRQEKVYKGQQNAERPAHQAGGAASWRLRDNGADACAKMDWLGGSPSQATTGSRQAELQTLRVANQASKR